MSFRHGSMSHGQRPSNNDNGNAMLLQRAPEQGEDGDKDDTLSHFALSSADASGGSPWPGRKRSIDWTHIMGELGHKRQRGE